MKSWQDLQRERERAAQGDPAPGLQAPSFAPLAHPGAAGAAAGALPAAAATPRLQQLMAERSQLQARMQALGGQGSDARDAQRFPVASAAQRREELQRWAARRGSRPAARETDAERDSAARRGGEPALPWRGRDSGPRLPGTPVAPQQWAALRDAPLQAGPLRPPRRAEDRGASAGRDAPRHIDALRGERAAQRSPDRPRDRSRDRTQDGSGDSLRALRDGAAGLLDRAQSALDSTAALDQRRMDRALDRALNRPELDDEQRRAARRAVADAAAPVRSALDGPRRQVQAGLDRARQALQAGERIERDWQQRREAIAGWDLERYARGYEQRGRRLLEVATGSIAQLSERMDALRDTLQQRRADQRDQDRRDEARRERALQRRQQRREEDKHHE